MRKEQITEAMNNLIFLDGVCPKCGSICGNGGQGPLRCKCGWVGETVQGDLDIINRLFAEEFGEGSNP